MLSHFRPVVYIGGAFRHPNNWGIQQNINRAAELALEVWQAGGAAVCPHLNAPLCFVGLLPEDAWLEGDLAILSRCEALLLVRGWDQSQGTRAEVKFAEKRGIPVFGTLYELERWMAERDMGGADAQLAASGY